MEISSFQPPFRAPSYLNWLHLAPPTMPPQKRSRNPSSSSSAPPNKAMQSIVHSPRLFRNSIPDPVKEDIKETESEAQLTRGCITDQEVKNEFEALVTDPGYSRGQTSLHLKTMDYYWQQKYLLGRALVERGELHEAILLKFDELSCHMHQIAGHLGIKLVDSMDSVPAYFTFLFSYEYLQALCIKEFSD